MLGTAWIEAGLGPPEGPSVKFLVASTRQCYLSRFPIPARAHSMGWEAEGGWAWYSSCWFYIWAGYLLLSLSALWDGITACFKGTTWETQTLPQYILHRTQQAAALMHLGFKRTSACLVGLRAVLGLGTDTAGGQ